jgi:hypothetical protein
MKQGDAFPVTPQRFNNNAIVHGKTFERRVVETFENVMNLKAKPRRLFVCVIADRM